MSHLLRANGTVSACQSLLATLRRKAPHAMSSSRQLRTGQQQTVLAFARSHSVSNHHTHHRWFSSSSEQEGKDGSETEASAQMQPSTETQDVSSKPNEVSEQSDAQSDAPQSQDDINTAGPDVDELLQKHGARNLPFSNEDPTSMSIAFDVRDFIEARAHLGHKCGVWNPRVQPYLLGKRFDTHIFDPAISCSLLRNALNFVRETAAMDGKVLFLATKRQFEEDVRRAATSCGEYFVTRRWMPGTLTNCQETLRANKLPEVIIVFNMPANSVAIKEAKDTLVPTIGIVDSDCDPTEVTYPVPGNDDTPSAVQFYLRLFTAAVKQGKQLGMIRKLILPENALDLSGLREKAYANTDSF